MGFEVYVNLTQVLRGDVSLPREGVACRCDWTLQYVDSPVRGRRLYFFVLFSTILPRYWTTNPRSLLIHASAPELYYLGPGAVTPEEQYLLDIETCKFITIVERAVT